MRDGSLPGRSGPRLVQGACSRFGNDGEQSQDAECFNGGEEESKVSVLPGCLLNSIDANKNGELTGIELHAAMRAHGPKANRPQVVAMMSDADKNTVTQSTLWDWERVGSRKRVLQAIPTKVVRGTWFLSN